jgi:phospholipid/cholesterol/gamma-HCH transport system substrate-binding protein
MKRWLPVVIAVAVVVAGALAIAWPWRTPQRTLTAHFTRAVGITAGSDVRILGVKVGQVESVTPEGRTVRVVMHYDAGWPIPAGAQAVIVPPSIVSDRYVQLTPAYGGGPALPDKADVPADRTAAPLEIDDIYQALDEFNQALGPKGANKDGALSDVIATGRANLDGNGQNLHDALGNLSKTLTTLANGRQDIFGTVANLQQFTTALAESDQQVREFNQRLADVAEQLAGERDELAAALRSLATALADVTAFIRDNRQALTSNVDALADVTGILVRQQKALINVLDVTPLALSNLNLAYNSRSGTLDTRDDALGPYDPASYICTVLVDALPVAQIPRECFALAQTLNANHLPLTDELKKLLGLPLPAQSAPSTATPPSPVHSLPPVPGVADTVTGTVDRTLGGILRGTP